MVKIDQTARIRILKRTSLIYMDGKDTSPTLWMRRLICVFAESILLYGVCCALAKPCFNISAHKDKITSFSKQVSRIQEIPKIHSAKVLIGHLEYSKFRLKSVSFRGKTYFSLWWNILEMIYQNINLINAFTEHRSWHKQRYPHSAKPHLNVWVGKSNYSHDTVS